jgi:hypothetical protein
MYKEKWSNIYVWNVQKPMFIIIFEITVINLYLYVLHSFSYKVSCKIKNKNASNLVSF